MTALRAREKSHDLRHWMDSFLTQLSQSPSEGSLADKVSQLQWWEPISNPCPGWIRDGEDKSGGYWRDAWQVNILLFPIIILLFWSGKYMQQTGWTKLCLLLDYDGYISWPKVGWSCPKEQMNSWYEDVLTKEFNNNWIKGSFKVQKYQEVTEPV